MISIKLKTLETFAQGHIYGEYENIEITSITTDSRKACEGALFACIKGERVDGHDYATKAVESGCAAILAERELADIAVPVIVVPDTLKALGRIANGILRQKNIPVVTIGGSVGKTSTKELIASVLSQKYNVLKTEGNYNNNLGLPLTVFNITEDTEVAVLELGIDDFGQMHELADIARPDICVLTNIGDCHLEQLGDRDGVLKAKSEMFDFIKEDGAIILNGDDEKLRGVGIVHGVAPTLYGTFMCPVKAYDIKKNGPLGSDFVIKCSLGHIKAHINMPGDHMILNALAACAVGEKLGLTREQIAKGIEDYRSINGRFNIITTDKCTIIDDCYNANPMSMRASLSSLSDMEGEKIAVLGDMGELGKDEEKMHYEIGEHIASLNIDRVFVTGELSKLIIKGAKDFGSKAELKHFDSKEDLCLELNNIVTKKSICLVKASHFMKFDEIVESLK